MSDRIAGAAFRLLAWADGLRLRDHRLLVIGVMALFLALPLLVVACAVMVAEWAIEAGRDALGLDL